MKTPNLSRMWETFILFAGAGSPPEIAISMIRNPIRPLINKLVSEGLIDWYSFLVHNRPSSVPTTEDDNTAYFHLRFSLPEGVGDSTFLAELPSSCQMTQKIDPASVSTIAGVRGDLLKGQEIELAWLFLGKQCAWMLDLIDSYEAHAPIRDLTLQVFQFLHYFSNMTQLQVK